MELEALFFGSHPDDVELTSGGLAALLASLGHQVGIIDLTRGELGTRGTVKIRAAEAQAAAKQLGVAHRSTLALPDGGLDRHDRVSPAPLGDFVVMGGHSGVVGHVKVGSGAQIAGSAHVKDDLAPGARVAGTPAVPFKEFARGLAAVSRLARRGAVTAGDADKD